MFWYVNDDDDDDDDDDVEEEDEDEDGQPCQRQYNRNVILMLSHDATAFLSPARINRTVSMLEAGLAGWSVEEDEDDDSDDDGNDNCDDNGDDDDEEEEEEKGDDQRLVKVLSTSGKVIWGKSRIGWLSGWLGRWLGGWLGGWLDGWLGGWLSGWLGGYTVNKWKIQGRSDKQHDVDFKRFAF